MKNYAGLLTTRFFLGLAEASVFPGCFYLIAMYVFRPSCQKSNGMALNSLSRWYKREEAQKRFTLLFCSTGLAGAFGGLLAYAISKLEGTAGLPSWRWVFVIGVSVFSLQ